VFFPSPLKTHSLNEYPVNGSVGDDNGLASGPAQTLRICPAWIHLTRFRAFIDVGPRRRIFGSSPQVGRSKALLQNIVRELEDDLGDACFLNRTTRQFFADRGWAQPTIAPPRYSQGNRQSRNGTRSSPPQRPHPRLCPRNIRLMSHRPVVIRILPAAHPIFILEIISDDPFAPRRGRL